MSLHCFDCDKIFKEDDKVYEFTVGVFDGVVVLSDETLEMWCEECEIKRSEK